MQNYRKILQNCNKIFKKHLFDDVKFKGKMWYEDLNIMLKIMHNIKKISVIHKGYYLCNCRDNSTMRNDNSKKNLDMIWAIDDAKEYLVKNNSLHCYPCRAMCCFARNELLNHVVPVVVNRYSLVRGTAIFAK